MSLKEYKRKRNFKKTPEPTGATEAASPGRQFVVQKHAARRLHYDFRLELDGTLKSWAVPKGPSLDPSVKALAVQVEDHPLDYATFEGVIPQGEYGGGTVMVWDRGTWEPEEDPDKGLKSGKLKFRLQGEKLRGSWALVRMSGRAGDDGKNWLLIKHRDEQATEKNILEQRPRSVLTKRTLEEIAADADRVWSSKQKSSAKRKSTRKPQLARHKNSTKSIITAKFLSSLPGARSADQPADFHPQLATLASQIPDGDDWLHELKFDGYRVLAFVADRQVRLVSRNGNDWTHRFRVVADAIATLPIDRAILDGEVVSLDKQGVSSFQQLQNLLKRGDASSLVYYLFDVPHLMGFDLTRVPLVKRKEVLSQLLLSASPDNEGTVRYSDHIRGHGESVLQHACRSAMEGVISKRIDSHYQRSRSASWLKVKCLKQQEFVIGGYSKPAGSRQGFGALLLGYYENGHLKYAGKVGTGFTNQSLRQIASELKKRTTDSSPFDAKLSAAEKRGVTWVKPELVGEVEFTEWTDDGRLRHPSFQGLREDKPAREVVREVEKSPADVQQTTAKRARRKGASPSKSRRADTQTGTKKRTRSSSDEAVVAGVRLTNPDRVLYPQQGITKRDLAMFYEQIADWVLPYVVDRPLTLVRCPEGHTGECFYQKHLAGYTPDAVHGVKVKEKGKTSEYVTIRDLAGLVSLVQIGVLEMHPWPARNDNLERPDYLVFDLDPGEGVAWKAVVQGARDVRDRLSKLGLTSYLRTTGGKGLHVCVPIQRRNSWDELKQFAKLLADSLSRDAPEKYIATMSKAKRRGKVYVDYLRNQRGATAIASYATRARTGAPVATPIAWDELTTRLRPDKYHVKNLARRLSKLSNDPWANFWKERQSITRAMMNALS